MVERGGFRWAWGGVSAPVLVSVGTLLVAFVVCAILMFSLSAEPAPGTEETAPPEDDAPGAFEGMSIPEFEGVAQDGRRVTRADFDGRHTVVSFGFSYCTLACPLMHGQLYRLTTLLEGTPVRYMTISVDAERDTPERLAAYAAQLTADTDRWTFVSVDAATVDAIVVEGLGFALEEDPAAPIELPGGGTMNNIVHPTRFFVVGPEGSVVAMYNAMSPNDVDRLAADLRRRVAG